MKKILLIIISLIMISFSYADDNTKQVNECLKKLAEEVKSQYNIDISDVTVNGVSANLSIYTGEKQEEDTYKYFSEILRENPTTEGCEYAGFSKEECKNYFSHVFFAKRNNISTIKVTPEIKGKGYWTATEFVTWGSDIGFQFPLKKRNDPQFEDYDYYDEGDDWGQVKQNMVYVQYIKDGTLLSCGFIKFNAGSNHNLNDLYQSNYMGNAFEGGSFENLEEYEINGDKFRGMKVRIRGLDWNKETLFNMDLVGIAYNSKSSYFNEYISYPLQVKAMLNVKNMEGDHSMYDVMSKYQKYMKNNTCLKLVHSSRSELPSFCHGQYKSKSNLVSYKGFSIKDKLMAFISEPVYAFSLNKEQKEKIRKKMEEENLSATQYGLKLSTWIKLNNLKDENIKNLLLYAVTPSGKAYIKNLLDKGEYVDEDYLVLYNCPLKKDDIIKNIEFIFSKYYKNGELNIPENVKYPNPEFGDCIIPFPDERHKDKYIKNSFVQNKVKYVKTHFNDKKIEEFENKLNKIREKYNQKLEKLRNEYKKALFEKNKEKEEKVKNEIKNTYNKMQKELENLEVEDKEFKQYVETKKEVIKKKQYQKEVKKGINNSYLLIGLGIILIVLSIFLLAKKNKNEKSN